MTSLLTRPFSAFGRVFLSAAVVLALALAGCGGDDEEQSAATAPTATAPEPAATEPAETAPTATAPEQPGRTAPERGRAPSSPEDVPGGAGDEQPIRVDARFTGRGGRVSPSKVAVVPFIAVRVVLRSADGSDYELALDGRTLRVDSRDTVDTARLEGLRSGERYSGSFSAATGSPERVEIVSSAEPGP